MMVVGKKSSKADDLFAQIDRLANSKKKRRERKNALKACTDEFVRILSLEEKK